MEDNTAEQFWERQYVALRNWGERVNPLLAETAEPLQPGTALDLGCGAGGDTIWLAQRDWQVTAVDISTTAVEQVLETARTQGLAANVRAEQHDLTRTFPEGQFDLVSAQYLQSPFALDRTQVLRNAAAVLRPGGRLLVVDHGSIAPWSWNQNPDTQFPTPTEIAADLDLDAGLYTVQRADMPQRQATGPDGQTATVTDNVLVVQRKEA